MSRLPLLLTLILACNNAGSGRREDSMAPPTTPPPSTSSATDAEVEQHLTLALVPNGNRPDLTQKEASIRWLVDHGDRAYPIVMARAKATPTPALVDVIGRLGRPDATAWLVELLHANGPATVAAGIALGGSPDPRARDVLIAALARPETPVVTAALDGLRVRGDRSICASLALAGTHANAEVRYVWVRAGAALGCLDAAALRALAASDPDADVKALAAQLAAAPPP
jgi:HEAT repeat protein